MTKRNKKGASFEDSHEAYTHPLFIFHRSLWMHEVLSQDEREYKVELVSDGRPVIASALLLTGSSTGLRIRTEKKMNSCCLNSTI